MPEIGEIKRGREIGQDHGRKVIFVCCPDCKETRWQEYHNYLKSIQAGRGFCRKCASRRERQYSWKGGRKGSGGYIRVLLEKDDFFYPMAQSDGYVMEHRLVMAKSLGRCLQPWEIVHHKGIRYSDIRNKSDNLRDNLELSCSLGEHILNHSKGYQDGYRKGYTDGRDKRIKELVAELNALGEKCK